MLPFNKGRSAVESSLDKGCSCIPAAARKEKITERKLK